MEFLDCDFRIEQVKSRKTSKMEDYEENKKLKQPVNADSVGKWKKEMNTYEKKLFKNIYPKYKNV